MRQKSSIFRTVLIGLFIGAVLLGSGVLWTLRDRVQQIRTAEQSDPLWIASRLQYEFLRLELDLASYVSNSKSSADIVKRYEIVWSRIDVMRSGKMARLIEEFQIDSNVFDSLEMTFQELEPLILSLPDSDSSAADRLSAVEEIKDNLGSYEVSLRDFTLALAQSKSLFMANFRNGLLSLSRVMVVLSVIILSLTAIFTTLLVIDLRASRNKTEEMRKLAHEAEVASWAKDKFMSMVSHELRTPLTSIMGGIQLLRSKHDNITIESSAKIVEIAHRNAERLLSLISDILDAQKIHEGQVSLNLMPTNLTSVIEETIDNLQGYAHGLNVDYSLVTEDAELWVMADRERLSQILSNFLSNAAKFTSAGDNIEIHAYNCGRHARVDVVDHGIGIPESERENIFTRFHQVDPGTTGPNKSSGLGLSISKQLIEMHQGEIGVDSIEGEGSKFWFTLRLAAENQTKCSKDVCDRISAAS